MSSIDFSSELADVYVSQMRSFRKGGKQPHWRPAVNRDEKLLAADVNRRVDRNTFGYLPPAESFQAASQPMCARCGATGALRVAGSLYVKSGRIDRWVCATLCQGASA